MSRICEGGELYDKIAENGRLSEAETVEIFTNVMRALNYCHKKGICHRDLKPENIMFPHPKSSKHAKIIDFGFAKHFVPEDLILTQGASKKVKMHRIVGSPQYLAPEILSELYDEKCDIWSAGIPPIPLFSISFIQWTLLSPLIFFLTK